MNIKKLQATHSNKQPITIPEDDQENGWKHLG